MIVTHEGYGRRRGVFVGRWAEQRCDEGREEVIVTNSRFFGVGRYGQQSGQGTSNGGPLVLAPFSRR